ncbi:MAG: hypothetical protein EOM19_01505 [Candidatus Moranbacteria bacterium]|nr:hypothetical protein [Candidatus Moranbacteria bacterium]
MTKFIEILNQRRRTLINVEKIVTIYPDSEHNAIIIIEEKEKNEVISTSTHYNKVREMIKNATE